MLNTKIGPIKLKTCIYNASGPRCTTKHELELLDAATNVGAVLTKSCTLEPREGNEKPRYWSTALGSINSNGLCNMGADYYINNIDIHCKPYIISVAGLDIKENLSIFNKMLDNPPDYVEFNLSCPNISGKPQTAYDFSILKETLRRVCEVWDQPLGIKMPPYFDPAHFVAVADIISEFGNIQSITAINSLGNGLIINGDRVAIRPRGGLGGIGGAYCKPTALANVYQWKNLLPYLDIIGCGGVRSGRDVYEHLLVGASAVQVGTFFYENGVRCFGEIVREFKEIMAEKKYESIKDIKLESY